MTKTAPRDESQTADFLDGPSLTLDLGAAAGQQIFDQLKRSILAMKIAPGTLISEADVARHFGASRTPVREAFMQLREVGLITTWPSRGNFVSKISRARIEEAHYIREALELANLRRIGANRLTDDVENALRHNLNMQQEAINAGDDEAFHHRDDAFHIALAAATNFPRAADLLEREKMVLDRLRVLSLSNEGRKRRLLSEHRAIFDALLSSDVAQAQDVMRQHLGSVLTFLSTLMQSHESYFT